LIKKKVDQKSAEGLNIQETKAPLVTKKVEKPDNATYSVKKMPKMNQNLKQILQNIGSLMQVKNDSDEISSKT